MIGKEIYRTYPPDITTFVNDPYFLGTIHGESLFPVWRKLLPEIYPAPLCKAYEEVILSTATRCLGKGTKIRMYDGSIKNIEDIIIGDKVLGTDGQPRKVLNTTSGIGNMYEVRTQRGNSIFTCNEDHELALKVIRDHKKPAYHITMPVKTYLNEPEYKKVSNYRLYYSNAIEYPKKNLSIDPYTLGTLLEDKYNQIPQEYLLSCIDDRQELLKSIIDNKGCQKKRFIQVTTKYEELAYNYAELAKSLGYNATISKRHKKPNYAVNINCKPQDLLTKFDIKPIGLGTYYGITVDKDNLFLGADYLVHKNCGKSTNIAISFAYEIMLLLCMINPAKTILGKASGSLVMAVLSKDNATAVGQVATEIYKILTLSPYFQSVIEGDLAFSNVEKKGVAITDNILLKAGSALATIVGSDMFACCLDEANIGTSKIAEEKLVETRLQLWQHAIDRRKATTDKAPAGTGIMWITSSPTEENDVIKARIEQVEDSGIPNVKIVDNLARWEARGTHATETFDFFIGSDTKDPCLLEDVPDLVLTEEELKERVMKIPRTIEYLSSFRHEPIRAIQEIAGRRTSPENAFFRSVGPFERVFYKDNPIFSQDEMKLTLNGYLDFDDYMIDKEYFMHPFDPECFRYIHLDIASKQDRFGLASVYSKRVNFKSEEGIETSRRMYFVDFCLGLKAQGGDAVDILKALDFLYRIKKQGYPIKLITTDSHQGELSRQYLEKISNKTVKTDYLSVEKTKDAYYNLKNLILTETLVGYKNPLLTKELKNLRENPKRIQKPAGDNYSDDMSDALAGALWTCCQDKYYMKTNEKTTSIIEQFKQQQQQRSMGQINVLNYGRQNYNFRPFNF
jgi:hypothetical protein